MQERKPKEMHYLIKISNFKHPYAQNTSMFYLKSKWRELAKVELLFLFVLLHVKTEWPVSLDR